MRLEVARHLIDVTIDTVFTRPEGGLCAVRGTNLPEEMAELRLHRHIGRAEIVGDDQITSTGI